MKQFTSGVCSHWGTRSCNMITAPGCTYVTPETQTSSDIKLLLHQELACPPIIITSQISQASLIMSKNISWSSNLAGNCFRSKWWQWQSNMKSWNQSWIEKVKYRIPIQGNKKDGIKSLPAKAHSAQEAWPAFETYGQGEKLIPMPLGSHEPHTSSVYSHYKSHGPATFCKCAM
jgi:hypothetical protein